MPNKPSKRQQLLAKHTPDWIEGGSSQKEKEQRQAETEAMVEQPVRPLKIKLRRQEQEPPNLAQGINMRTQEEEAEEEPADDFLCRQKRSDAEQQGDESGSVKDITPTPSSKGREPRQEIEPVRQEVVTPVLPEPVIELPISPSR